MYRRRGHRGVPWCTDHWWSHTSFIVAVAACLSMPRRPILVPNTESGCAHVVWVGFSFFVHDARRHFLLRTVGHFVPGNPRRPYAFFRSFLSAPPLGLPERSYGHYDGKQASAFTGPPRAASSQCHTMQTGGVLRPIRIRPAHLSVTYRRSASMLPARTRMSVEAVSSPTMMHRRTQRWQSVVAVAASTCPALPYLIVCPRTASHKLPPVLPACLPV